MRGLGGWAAAAIVVAVQSPGDARAHTTAHVIATGHAASANRASGAAPLGDWPEFGLNPQRTNATGAATGITAANVKQLHLRQVHLPGTADNSAIFLSNINVDGTVQNAVIVTTTYGITEAIDPSDGHTLWQFTPPGIGAVSSSSVTTSA